MTLEALLPQVPLSQEAVERSTSNDDAPVVFVGYDLDTEWLEDHASHGAV